MRLKVTPATPTVFAQEPKQMEVGILYEHTLTNSVILCTRVSDAWGCAKGICLVKGQLNREEWPEYPIWSFTEPKNYKPYKGALKLQNEFRVGEG